MTRAAARQPPEPALDSAEEEQSGAPQSFLDTPSGSVAVSNKPAHHALHSSDYRYVKQFIVADWLKGSCLVVWVMCAKPHCVDIFMSMPMIVRCVQRVYRRRRKHAITCNAGRGYTACSG